MDARGIRTENNNPAEVQMVDFKLPPILEAVHFAVPLAKYGVT